MKKSIFFLLLITTTGIGAQKYVPFPTGNAEWNEHFKNWSSTGGLSSYIIQYFQQGDTVFNGKIYRKIYCSSPTTQNQSYYRGGIREENKRIFWIDNSNSNYSGIGKFLSNSQKNCIKQQIKTNTKEIILYDFNKTNIGDTLFSLNYSIGKIIAIDSLKINNSYRKRYKLSPYLPIMGWQYTNDYVIEGIGSVRNGLLASATPLLACLEPPMWEFVSFQSESQLLYKNPAYINYNNIARWDEMTNVPFPTKDAIWNYRIVPGPFSDSSQGDVIMSIGDSIISGDSVRYNINRKYSYYPIEAFGQLRINNQTKRVYFKYNYGDEDILYDFSLLVGDTIKYKSMPFQNNYAVVENMDSINVNGTYRKRWYLRNSIINSQDIWIDGIGSVLRDGLLNPYLRSFVTDGSSTYFGCFKHNSDIYLSQFVTSIDCPCSQWLVNVPEVKDSGNNFSVTFNPINNKLNIQSEFQGMIGFELLDLKGSVMLRTSLNALENTVDLSRYDKGLYLYRISANGALLKAGKIVKN